MAEVLAILGKCLHNRRKQEFPLNQCTEKKMQGRMQRSKGSASSPSQLQPVIHSHVPIPHPTLPTMSTMRRASSLAPSADTRAAWNPSRTASCTPALLLPNRRACSSGDGRVQLL